jgi:hypothetical protein
VILGLRGEEEAKSGIGKVLCGAHQEKDFLVTN